MAKFKVGDRVRVVRGYYVMTPRTGWTGTVRHCTEESVVADWDNVGRRRDGDDVCGVDMVELIEPATDFEARIEAIEKRLDEMCPKPDPDYKFGDKVEASVPSGGRGYSWLPAVIVDNWHGIGTSDRKVCVEGRLGPLNLPLSRIRPA